MSKYSKSGQSSVESFNHQMVSEEDEKYNSKFILRRPTLSLLLRTPVLVPVAGEERVLDLLRHLDAPGERRAGLAGGLGAADVALLARAEPVWRHGFCFET